MPTSLPRFRTLWCAAFVVVAGNACASSSGVPLLRRAGVVAIDSRTTPAPALALSPEAFRPERPIRIRGTFDGPRLMPNAFAPAFVIDGRLWCPRRGPTGRFTETAAAVLALDAETMASMHVARDSAATRVARRCAAPVNAVIRIRTRGSAQR